MTSEYTLAQIERLLCFIKEEYERHCQECNTCQESNWFCETGLTLTEQSLKWGARNISQQQREEARRQEIAEIAHIAEDEGMYD